MFPRPETPPYPEKQSWSSLNRTYYSNLSSQSDSHYSCPLYLPPIQNGTPVQYSMGKPKNRREFVYFPDITPSSSKPVPPKNSLDRVTWSADTLHASGQRILRKHKERSRDVDNDNVHGLKNSVHRKSVFPYEDSWSAGKAKTAAINVINRHRLRINELSRSTVKDTSMEKKCRHWLLAGSYFDPDDEIYLESTSRK